MIVPIGCPGDCRGEGYPCIQNIEKVIANGNVAFMIYAQHVMDKIETMNFKIEVKEQNGIPIGMYISSSDGPSVYERFH